VVLEVWKENNEITIDIEDSQGNIIVDQKQAFKIWEMLKSYITELIDQKPECGTGKRSR
jgi:hypothetical protein